MSYGQDEQQQNPNAEFEVKYKPMATLEIIRAMDEQRALKEDLDEQLKAVNKEYDFLRLNMIPNRFEEEGIENMKVDGIGRVSLTGDMYVSILAEKKEEAYEYFRDIGKGSLIVPTINASTLKATVKAMMKNGEEVPEELIKVTPFTRASITKR